MSSQCWEWLLVAGLGLDRPMLEALGTLTELGAAAARLGVSVLWFWWVGLWMVVPGALAASATVLEVVEANVVVEVD